MREVLTAEVNFAIVSVYITRHCSLWAVLLGVLGRQTVHQAQQVQQQSQYVGGSRPTVALWPMKKAAEADKTQICWVPWSQSWPSTDLTCSQNTKKTVGCTEGYAQVFATAFLQIHKKLSTINHRYQPRGGLDLMKWVSPEKTEGYFCCSNTINVSGRGEVTIQFGNPVFSPSLNES